MLRMVLAVLVAVVAMLGAGDAIAARKKAPPPAPKPIYEAPMRVVIVRLSNAVCEPLCPEWIAAEGEITAATPAQFRKVFKQMGKKKLPIVIRSPGGSINHAIEIGRMVRKRGLDVAVGATVFTGCAPDQPTCKLPKEQAGIYRGVVSDYRGFCNSACPLILSGGVNRYAGSSASVGVHKPRTVWTNERVWYRETYRIVKGKKKVISRKITRREKLKPKVTFGYDKRLRKTLTAFYREMGVDPAVISESEEAEFKDLNTLTPAQLQGFRLRTSPESAGALATARLCATTRPGHCVEDASRTPPKAAPQIAETPMTFTLATAPHASCGSACPAWIAANGTITADTPKHFRSFLEKLGGTHAVVILNAKDGDTAAARELAEIIRAKGYDTMVAATEAMACGLPPGRCRELQKGGFVFAGYKKGEPSTCGMACVFAFLGGKERVLPPEPELLLSYGTSTDKMLLDFNNKMGATVFFTQVLTALKGRGTLRISAREARSHNVATWIWDDAEKAFGADGCSGETGRVMCPEGGFRTLSPAVP